MPQSHPTGKMSFIPAATGAVQPLTKDSETYFALSLDKMAGLLVSTQVKADFRLRLFNLENPSNNQVLADALTVAFAPNERIVFSSAMSGNDEIWSINADGSEQRQLTNDAADDTSPVSPDGKKFAVAQGSWRHDAVLMKGLR